MDQTQWDAKVNALWATMVARYIPPAKPSEPGNGEPPISPLPPKREEARLGDR